MDKSTHFLKIHNKTTKKGYKLPSILITNIIVYRTKKGTLKVPFILGLLRRYFM